MFITLEGGEGCGKSTHAVLLKRYLVRKGYRVVLTKEPGGSRIGRVLRRVILRTGKPSSRLSELFLFASDRAEHVAGVIAPALSAGKIVISDRFIDSTTAYQIGGRKLPADMVGLINRLSSLGLKPDITFLLDVPVRTGLRRAARRSRKDRFEAEKLSFHNRVRKMYLKIARSEPKRVKVITTFAAQDKVQQKIRELIDEKL